MALNQMRAVTNRRLRPNYVAAINAQTPYLPQIYQRKYDDEYRSKLYDQQERSLAQQSDIAQRNEALGWANLDEQRKQRKKAQNLGYANMALGGLTGLANLYQATKPLSGLGDVAPELSNVATDILPDLSPTDFFTEFGTGATPVADTVSNAVANTGEFWDFGGTTDWGVTDLVPDVVKNIGSSIWDAGGSFLDDIGGLFS